MTSIAFLLGVVPLMLATGAGAAARNSLGTAVFGGMLVSTVVNLIFIPEPVRAGAEAPGRDDAVAHGYRGSGRAGSLSLRFASMRGLIASPA